MYSLTEIAQIVGGELFGETSKDVKTLVFDSRKLGHGDHSLFFALKTSTGDGHNYIEQLAKSNILGVVVERHFPIDTLNQIVVKDTTVALQQLAAYHRSEFNIPVFGVTGSNGKTIVKEWLARLLSTWYKVHKSPKSYNSQIGVPLSIWPLNSTHEVAIIEAGISFPGEMQKLERIIKPTIGVFTHLGDAHGIHFKDESSKLYEKFELFGNTETVICQYSPNIVEVVESKSLKPFYWGKSQNCHLQLRQIDIDKNSTSLELSYNKEVKKFRFPFADKSSVENAISSISGALLLGITLNQIAEQIAVFQPIDMRLQQVQGINGNALILDYYNADLQSLVLALDFLNQQQSSAQKLVILSDIIESDNNGIELYAELNTTLISKKVDMLIGIGPEMKKYQNVFSIKAEFFESTSQLLEQYPVYTIKNSTILIKGARPFEFEKIVEQLINRVHQTVLEVNMSRLLHNLAAHKKVLPANTKIMAMVKALSYGAGGYQVAKLLEYSKVDYLGVAYVDEAVSLRKAGIQTPIMILNADFSKTTTILEYQLEPVIYSLSTLEHLIKVEMYQSLSIHLEFDTGMHRLGLEESEIDNLIAILINAPQLKLASVYSHLAVADDPLQNAFTLRQIAQFQNICSEIELALGYSVVKHIANSAGIQIYPSSAFDMVRLGVGLYGVGMNTSFKEELLPVGCFKSYIAQIRTVKANDGIGYGQHDKSGKDRKIAVVAVGYADGFNRLFSKGNGYFLINNKKAQVVGNVCMDMTMCDVTNIDCTEGDEVVIFGDNPSVEELAEAINTILYEILTSVSERVNRVFYQE